MMPGVGAYCIEKGAAATRRVTNFKPLRTSTPLPSAEDITRLLEQPFPAVSGTDNVSVDSIRASKADPELFETAYTDYLHEPQPFPARVTRSSTRALSLQEAQSEPDQDKPLISSSLLDTPIDTTQSNDSSLQTSSVVDTVPMVIEEDIIQDPVTPLFTADIVVPDSSVEQLPSYLSDDLDIAIEPATSQVLNTEPVATPELAHDTVTTQALPLMSETFTELSEPLSVSSDSVISVPILQAAKSLASPLADELSHVTDESVLNYWSPIVNRAMLAWRHEHPERHEPPEEFVVPFNAPGYLPEAYGMALGKMMTFLRHSEKISLTTSPYIVYLAAQSDEPKFEKALQGPDAEAWQKAFEDVEISDLVRRSQFRPVTNAEEIHAIPESDFIGVLIRCTTKRDRDGIFIRRKVRAALRGDLDMHVKDLFTGRFDTYSPSLGWGTFFLLIAMVALHRWYMILVDVTAAFAYNIKRDHPMYVRLKPQWFRDGVARIYEVMCTMYGLKEASMQFYILMSEWLISKHWEYGASARCLFMRGSLVIGLSTDDLLIILKCADRTELDAFIVEFKDRWECTISDPVLKYLGVEINYSADGTIKLAMKLKIEKLKELLYPELGLHVFPEVKVYDPLLSTWSENASNESESLNSTLHFQFRMIVGLILFITKVRYDVLHTISLLSSRTHRPSKLDLAAAVHCANYLMFTRDIPLVFAPAKDSSDIFVRMEGAGDVAFRSRNNSSSQQGSGLKVITDPTLGLLSPTGMVLCSSRASKGMVDLTVNDGETRVHVELAKDCSWSKLFMKDIFGKDSNYDTFKNEPIPIWTDNEALNQNLNTFMLSRNQRHIRAAIHYLKQQEEANVIQSRLQKGTDMTVDTLTKSLPTTKKALDMEVLLGPSKELSAFIETVKHRPRSPFKHRIDECLDPTSPNHEVSLHELVSIAKSTDNKEMDDDCEEDLRLANLAQLAFNNADLNALHLTFLTSAIIPADLSYLSPSEKDQHRISIALDNDPVLYALVAFDLQRSDSMIIQDPPPTDLRKVHWKDTILRRCILSELEACRSGIDVLDIEPSYLAVRSSSVIASELDAISTTSYHLTHLGIPTSSSNSANHSMSSSRHRPRRQGRAAKQRNIAKLLSRYSAK